MINPIFAVFVLGRAISNRRLHNIWIILPREAVVSGAVLLSFGVDGGSTVRAIGRNVDT